MPLLVLYILPMSAFIPQCQSWVVSTKTVWPMIIKYLLSGHLQITFINLYMVDA